MSREIRDEYGVFVDGEMQSGIETFQVRDPATNDVITTVAESGEQGVTRAIESCTRAGDDWSTYDPEERGQLLRDVADAIRDNAEFLKRVETREMGRPVYQTERQVQKAAKYFDYYAGLTDKIEGQTICVPGNRHNYTIREPIGVTGHIVPWNASLNLGARSIAPALACGNTVVAKPSPEAPLSLLELAPLAVEAGLPPGVLNVVPGDGPRTGAAVSGSSEIGSLVFTGSRETGKIVMEAAAQNVNPVSLELGGNSPYIVFEDADVEAAATEALHSLWNAGQMCHSGVRMFVHEDVYDRYVDLVRQKMEEMTIGPGIDDPDLGPLITRDAQDRVEDYVEEAREDGARVLTGGEIPREDGNFYAPTLIDGVADDHPISCDEVFGPVLKAYKFESKDEVLRRANDTEFGLYGVIWTDDLARAHSVARDLEIGALTVNEYPATFIQAPFGGYKESGVGREKGMQAIEHHTQLKNVNVNLDR